MRELIIAWAIPPVVALALGLIATAGCASKRASVPNPINGVAHTIPGTAR